jgi:CcmD family protein
MTYVIAAYAVTIVTLLAYGVFLRQERNALSRPAEAAGNASPSGSKPESNGG